MGSTRQFDFITGIESSALPTASDPTLDDDFMTKGYADANYGAGGGGGSLTWNAPDGSAPLSDEEAGSQVYLFGDDLDQKLVAFVKVPSTYIAELQILLKIAIYSPSTSNNMLLRTRSYLVRQDVDSALSTTNLYTSTNTELTNTVANAYREVTIDLTDADGEINSIDVAPSNLIRVEIYRDTDNESTSDTADSRFISSASTVKFTA